MDQVGIQETTNAAKALLKVADVIAQKIKAGGGVVVEVEAVVAAVLADDALKASLSELYQNYQKIPDELKDLSLSEGFQLMQVVGPDLLKLVSDLRS